MCAGLLQSVPRGAAECVQGYRVCAGCSFNILPCSTRLNQKIFYWKKKYFIWMCIKNKNYMENWLFWGLNLGNLKQCMMIMLVLTSSSSAWTLCSLLHISSLINICNFYSFWATGMVLTSKWGRILQEIHCQCQIWLNCPAAGRKPANFHKRNYLLSVNTTDFEKKKTPSRPTVQCHGSGADFVCVNTTNLCLLCKTDMCQCQYSEWRWIIEFHFLWTAVFWLEGNSSSCNQQNEKCYM